MIVTIIFSIVAIYISSLGDTIIEVYHNKGIWRILCLV